MHPWSVSVQKFQVGTGTGNYFLALWRVRLTADRDRQTQTRDSSFAWLSEMAVTGTVRVGYIGMQVSQTIYTSKKYALVATKQLAENYYWVPKAYTVYTF